MISIKRSGNFTKSLRMLKREPNYIAILNKYGKQGVQALSEATPVDSGNTASSWDYEVVSIEGGYSIIWSNTNNLGQTPVAALLQYGHATKNGGWVEGIDYINPALKSLFDRLVTEAWREVGI